MKHKFNANESDFSREIRKRNLTLSLKEKKVIIYRKVLDTGEVALSDLYKTCTIKKTVKLNGNTMEVEISIN